MAPPRTHVACRSPASQRRLTWGGSKRASKFWIWIRNGKAVQETWLMQSERAHGLDSGPIRSGDLRRAFLILGEMCLPCTAPSLRGIYLCRWMKLCLHCRSYGKLHRERCVNSGNMQWQLIYTAIWAAGLFEYRHMKLFFVFNHLRVKYRKQWVVCTRQEYTTVKVCKEQQRQALKISQLFFPFISIFHVFYCCLINSAAWCWEKPRLSAIKSFARERFAPAPFLPPPHFLVTPARRVTHSYHTSYGATLACIELASTTLTLLLFIYLFFLQRGDFKFEHQHVPAVPENN